MLVDQAHTNFHTATGRYLPFAETLRRDGYLVEGSADAFAPEVLRSARVLVVANARQPIGPNEVTAVRDWVANGGSLLLITDHPPFVEPAMELGKAFGIRLRNAAATGDFAAAGRLTFRRSDGILKDHPITQGIDQVVTFTGSSFQIETPNPVPLEGHLQGAVMRFGAGRVAVFAEAAMFSAQVTGPNRSPMGMNAPIAKQNFQFLLNLMHWLTGLR
ncbi:MAG: DUF4350 domain-containing protein [Gemmatimonadales bacterium]